jgi:hypothetical protein
MFRRFYYESCLAAVAQLTESDIEAQKFLASVSCTFETLFSDLQDGKPSLEIRNDVLEVDAHLWATLKSNVTCLFCLVRGTELALACGHAPCDVCIRRASVPGKRDYRYKIPFCKLCLAKVNGSIRQKPPTVGPCVLSLDGGGIKGAGAQEILKMMQLALGPAQPLQDYFDYVIGTSTGRHLETQKFLERANPV